MRKYEEYCPKFTGSFIGREKVLDNYEVCRVLDEIISSPSVNPDEKPCGFKIIEICEREGLNYEVVPIEGTDRFNIMITYGAKSCHDQKLGLMIHGHYDTVPVMEMEDPFNTTITDNKMWGRGSVDQKGGLVAGICSLIALKRSGAVLKKPVCVAAVIDEESEHRGSYVLGQSDIKADYAIVTEPTNGNRCEFGCRGTTPVKITIKGRTAHAGAPWKGINSIEKAVPILEGLMAMRFPTVDLGELGELKGTLCISMIDGGSAYNNVPGETSIMLDRRTVPGETNASALEDIRKVIEKAAQRDPELKATAEIARPDWKWAPIIERGLNPTLTDPDCELYDVMSRAAARSGAEPLTKSLFEGYNDMDFLVNDLGIPTLVYGPGNAEMCHAPIEEVDIDQVCSVADVFCNMITELCI